MSPYINDKNIASIPGDARVELVLPFVHLLKPLSGDDFVLFQASKLGIVSSTDSSSLGIHN
jgi:hypothetical protein